MTLHYIDITIVIAYLFGVVGLGLYLRRFASQNIDQYFLAGKKLHWFLISISGSVGFYDVTGTMWIVSMFYIMGLKSMWIHWSWCFLLPAAYMTFGGKWVRRSQVMTGAEWLVTRFGDDIDGKCARLLYSALFIVFTMGMTAYAFQGIGKFVSVYFPVSESTGALIVIGVTACYVILGGFYSVIFTDLLQTVVLTLTAIGVTIVCYNQISYEQLAAAVPREWMEMAPSWRPEYLSNTEYKFFGALAFAWVVKGMLVKAGGPLQLTEFQRFLATRSARDACKVGAGWSLFLFTRWGMIMGIVALAAVGVDGITDTEKVLPYVLNTYLPVGLKGLVLAGFIAAFMSTFDSNINSGASCVVKDIYQELIRPNASQRELTWAGYIASFLLIALGIAIGYNTKSIDQIWMWILMVLGTGVMIPNILRWFWWRFNGWGLVGSLGVGMILSIYCTLFMDDDAYSTVIRMYVILTGSLISTILFTLLTRPTDEKVLMKFYRTVRPGGFWKPVRTKLGPEFKKEKKDSFARDLFNTFIAMIVIGCYFYTPVYGVIHCWTIVWKLASIGLLGSVVLYFTWYRYLPDD